MHKHTHTDRSGAGSSLQKGAGIIHDDNPRSECAHFDSNGPWNGCLSQPEIDFFVDAAFSNLQGHFIAAVPTFKQRVLHLHQVCAAGSPEFIMDCSHPAAVGGEGGCTLTQVTWTFTDPLVESLMSARK